ncbi:hypothetical protein CBER1_11202 [Cercospora berteroae]|uniref:NAD-dependent epimerase/dehydratase domain-containing protein n=1 Tax=Cercospora berteroae TaxID=357750 RepID=A0A2S6BZI8_9PEZI|nr:hypothetical protein CBER1_11202 [Cercospora berteroae]
MSSAQPKLPLTGTTGYVGGTVLDTPYNAHPEYNFTAILRKDPPSNFKSKYPNVKVIKGSYDDAEILQSAAKDVDIVVHSGDSDHLPSLQALVSGLLNDSQPGKRSPKFLIHLSGTAIISDWRSPEGKLGSLNPQIWSDISDIDSITSRPEGELHQHTDEYLQDTARTHGEKLKIAIVCPPDIYGKGHGTGKIESGLVPAYLREAKKIGAAFFGGEGQNSWSWVHIDDLAKVYERLVEEAVAGGGQADWGVEGYYFAASQEHNSLDFAREGGKILQKYGALETAEPKQVPLEQIDGMADDWGFWGFPHFGTYMFAANSRSKADRAAKKLGYRPTAPGLLEPLERDFVAAL